MSLDETFHKKIKDVWYIFNKCVFICFGHLIYSWQQLELKGKRMEQIKQIKMHKELIQVWTVVTL